MFDIEKCDILNENGKLYLIYDYEDTSVPPEVLKVACSYRDMNNFALKLFGEEEWTTYMIKMSGEYNDYTVDSLVEDLYQNHHELYVNALKALSHKHMKGDSFKMVSNDRVNEDGDRVAKFTAESLEPLDIWTLKIFGDVFNIEDFNFMDRDELIEAISESEFVIDDEDDACDSDDCDCCNDDNTYLAMKVVRTDKDGHRWATFDPESIAKLDDETLNMLAEDMEIPNYDLKTRAELIKEICSDECDIDSDDYDCGCEVKCDGNCENCGWEDVDDDDVEIPDMHDTGKLDAKGRKIFEYDRHEIEDLSMNTLCDMADSLMVDLDDVMDKDDLIDKLCDVVALVDSDHENWPQQVVSKVETPSLDTQQYESVDGPQHYNGTECIEEMRNLYGDDAVRWFCVCNAYKYRFRKGNKPGQDAAQDEAKARWYEKYASNMMRNTQY